MFSLYSQEHLNFFLNFSALYRGSSSYSNNLKIGTENSLKTIYCKKNSSTLKSMWVKVCGHRFLLQSRKKVIAHPKNAHRFTWEEFGHYFPNTRQMWPKQCNAKKVNKRGNNSYLRDDAFKHMHLTRQSWTYHWRPFTNAWTTHKHRKRKVFEQRSKKTLYFF